MREQKMVDGPDKHRLAADAAASRQKKLDRKNIGPIVP